MHCYVGMETSKEITRKAKPRSTTATTTTMITVTIHMVIIVRDVTMAPVSPMKSSAKTSKKLKQLFHPRRMALVNPRSTKP
jgi:hypothetical protein